MQNPDALQSLSRIDHLERRSAFIQWFLVVLFLVIIGGPILLGWWIGTQVNEVGGVSIENARVVGDSAVCPGDRLMIAFDFHAQGAGLLDVDSTLWATEQPPRTLIYSTSRRFVLSESINQQITEAWYVPTSYTDFATGDVTPLPPGTYRRAMAISSPTRSTVLATATIEFEVADCL